VAHFEQEDDPNHPKYNKFHPSTRVTEELKTLGVRFIDPGTKKGVDDHSIKERLKEVADELGSKANDACVVLIANDKDFAYEV